MSIPDPAQTKAMIATEPPMAIRPPTSSHRQATSTPATATTKATASGRPCGLVHCASETTKLPDTIKKATNRPAATSPIRRAAQRIALVQPFFF